MHIQLTLLFLFIFLSCQGQENKRRLIGGRCEGCEAVFEQDAISATDTLPEFSSGAPQLVVHGTIYEKDGKTPAEGVVVYAYHTNQEGIYPKKGDETGWGRRHGYLRGWVRTNDKGQYTFYTTRPAGYPDSQAPQHIHMTILEPDGAYYYIDDILFTDDIRLTSSLRNQMGKRGGSGIVTPTVKNGCWELIRDIVLGRNIPGYSN